MDIINSIFNEMILISVVVVILGFFEVYVAKRLKDKA